MPARTSADPADRPCLVGLTGGLASGKSTVAGLLRKRGIPVRDADVIVSELYRPGGGGSRVVREIFGESFLDDSGAVNRNALVRRIFSDPEAKSRLEEAVHGLVRKEIAGWLAGLETPIAVVEAALLVETGGAGNYDLLLVVFCGREEQRKRALARGMSPERADALLGHQLGDEARKAAADVLIDNSGSAEDLKLRVDEAWARVESLCEQLRNRIR